MFVPIGRRGTGSIFPPDAGGVPRKQRRDSQLLATPLARARVGVMAVVGSRHFKSPLDMYAALMEMDAEIRGGNGGIYSL